MQREKIQGFLMTLSMAVCLISIQTRHPGSGEVLVSSDHIVSIHASDPRCSLGPSIVLDQKTDGVLCPLEGFNQIKETLKKCVHVRLITQ
jgi:hypothetical protein